MAANRSDTDFAKRTFGPATGLSDMFVGNLARFARYQCEFTDDLMAFTLQQMSVTLQARDSAALMAQQHEISKKFAEKAQHALARLAADSQAGLATWFEEVTATGKAA